MKHDHSAELLEINGIDYDVAQIEARLKPKGASQVGFLGENECLVKVIDDDRKILKELGIDYETFVRFLYIMTNNYEMADVSSNEYLKLISGYHVHQNSNRDSQHCPWGDQREGGLGNAIGIIKAKSKFEIGTTGLTVEGIHPHLIKHHNFFEGKGTGYRLDPLTFVFYCGIPVDKQNPEGVSDLFYKTLRDRLTNPANDKDLWTAGNSIPMLENHRGYTDLLNYGLARYQESDHKDKQLMINFLSRCTI